MMIEPNRELMRRALNSPALAPDGLDPLEITATIEAARNALLPSSSLPKAELEAALDATIDALRPLGAKVMPLASEEQGRAWIVAVATALSDLPARYVVQAARSALHVVFKFPNEVEASVRTMAEALVENHERAIRRMEAMCAEIERARRPKQPQLPTPEPKPWTVERVRKTPRYLVNAGIAGGFIDPAIVDEADALDAAELVAESTAATQEGEDNA